MPTQPLQTPQKNKKKHEREPWKKKITLPSRNSKCKQIPNAREFLTRKTRTNNINMEMDSLPSQKVMAMEFFEMS